jgi:hypothetical protein
MEILILILLLLSVVFALMRAWGWGPDRPHFGWLAFAMFVATFLLQALQSVI